MLSPDKEEQFANAEELIVSSDSENTTFVSAEQPLKDEPGTAVISGISMLSILLQPENHWPPPLFAAQSGKMNSPASAEHP